MFSHAAPAHNLASFIVQLQMQIFADSLQPVTPIIMSHSFHIVISYLHTKISVIAALKLIVCWNIPRKQ